MRFLDFLKSEEFEFDFALEAYKKDGYRAESFCLSIQEPPHYYNQESYF
jgi:hypothetical protein